MKFRVRILRRANADLVNIVDYIHKRSPQGAVAWLDALETATVRLADDAGECSRADEHHRFDIEVKQSLFKTKRGRIYRLLFTVVGNEVRILRIRGSGQAPVKPDDL